MQARPLPRCNRAARPVWQKAPVSRDTRGMPSPINLDGQRFAMVSSTASIVDPQSPTTFTYHQDGLLVWGEYTGDTVTEGRFVGSVDGDVVGVCSRRP